MQRGEILNLAQTPQKIFLLWMKAKFQISPFRSMMFVILTPQFEWCFKYKHHGKILVFESNSTFFSGIWLKFWNLEALIWAESGVIP